ncbi:hypothetical protein YC2023_011304 [Brassica napus]
MENYVKKTLYALQDTVERRGVSIVSLSSLSCTSRLHRSRVATVVAKTLAVLMDYTLLFQKSEQFDSHFSQIWVPSNPKGAERLLPGIIASESDLYLRRFWGNPEEV